MLRYVHFIIFFSSLVHSQGQMKFDEYVEAG